MGTRDIHGGDDRPRRPRRFDDDDRPPRRVRRRRRSKGPGVGKVIAIVTGGLSSLGVVAAVVTWLVGGGGFGTGSINYQQYESIKEYETIAGLEKKYGRGRKIDPKDWHTTYPGRAHQGPVDADKYNIGVATTLGGINYMARDVTSWHQWKNGAEEVYVAEGTDFEGRAGLVLKLYVNPKVLEDWVRKGGQAPHSWSTFEQLGVGGKFQFGGL